MYNRDYLTDQTNSYSNESSKQAYIMSFLKATYQLFAGSLLAATAGAYIGLGIVNYIAGPMMWVLFAIELALIFFVIPRVKHTPGVNLAVLFVFTFILNLCIEVLGIDRISAMMLGDTVFQPVIAALIGLLPNCAASVILTQLYLSGAISFASVIAGLCTGAGIGLVVLFKVNPDKKENVKIIAVLYGIAVAAGLILELFGV